MSTPLSPRPDRAAPAGSSHVAESIAQVPAIRAVIFDLDGTLLDTADEIALALAHTFGELGLAPLSKPAVVALIGRGIRSLVERALQQAGSEGAAVDPGPTVARFEGHYARLVATAAEPFPDVCEGLAQLRAQGMPMAVVTNKARRFSERLLDRPGWRSTFAALVCGDDGLPRKPHGAMLTAACERMGARAAQTLMLGDSDNDVLAARHAGCPVWCVPYGYNEGRPAAALACDRLVGSVAEAARLIVSK